MGIQTNIYDSKIYFALSYDNKFIPILEPMKWNSISNHIPRDPKEFGFQSDFLEDKYGMLFSFIEDEGLTGGGEIIEQVYKTRGKGSDYEMFFEFGILLSQTYLVTNKWRVNLNDYEKDFAGVSVTIEKMPFQAKYRARKSSVCTVNGYSTVDGELLTPISTWQARLHSKTLLETTKCLSGSPQLSNETNANLDWYYIIQPDLSNHTIDELTQVFNQPMGLIWTQSTDPNETGTPASPNVAALDMDPFRDNISQYQPSFSGNAQIKFSGSFNFYSHNIGGGHTWWATTPRIVIQRQVAGVWTIVQVVSGTTFNVTTGVAPDPAPVAPMIGTYPFNIATAGLAYLLPSVTGSTARHQVMKMENCTFNETFSNLSVQQGDNIYIQLVMCNPFAGTGGFPGFMQVDQYTNIVEITQLTTAPPTRANGFRIFDVLNQMLENITGQKNALISPFFAEGGFGYKYLLMNGYSVRNFGSLSYNFKENFDSLFNSLQSIFCLGKGIKKLADGTEKVVIDYIDAFYKDAVIDTFPVTSNWKEINRQKYIVNNVQLGYNKWEGLNLKQQDSFCTSAEYLLQFVKTNNVLIAERSNIIACGDLIEAQRRNQFSTNPNQTLTNDNDIFIIATSEPCRFYDQLLFFASEVGGNLPTIGFPQIMALQYYDNIIIYFGGAVGQMLFRINSQVSGFPIYLTTPGIVDNYYIEGQGIWAPGTWNRNNWVFNPGDGLNYLCYVTVTSGTSPDLDPAHWILWSALTGGWDFVLSPSSPDQIFAERNECFEICSNVIDPATIYNGRLAPKNILYNWRPLLGVALYFIDPLSEDYQSSQIVTTLVKMNSLFTHKFRSAEPNKGNAGDLILVEFNKETVRNYLLRGTSLFTPVGAECEISVGWNRMNVIRQALSGETGTDKDNGGLILGDDIGKFWFCQIEDIVAYNFVTQMAKLQIQIVREVSLILG